MNIVWLIIDGLITAPAWMAGYTFQAYKNAFWRGVSSYNDRERTYKSNKVD